jgi:hypothetical protein
LPLQQIVCLQHPAKRNGMRRNAFDEMTEPDERQCLRSHATYRDADLRMAAASDRRPLTPLPRADRPGSLLPGHLCSARACRSSLSSHRNARAVPESFEYPSRSPAGAWQMSVAVGDSSHAWQYRSLVRRAQTAAEAHSHAGDASGARQFPCRHTSASLEMHIATASPSRPKGFFWQAHRAIHSATSTRNQPPSELGM